MGASSQFDIVARLQLRAEQFSSESGRSFNEMAARAQRAAAGVRDSFGQSFAEVQKLAERSLKLPRTAAGSLDLSSEIASLRQAATASDQTAAAQRELSSAMLAASTSGRVVTESMRLEADAAMVAARASEADAGAIRQRILALEEVQRELNKTASATRLHSQAANDNTLKAGQQRAGMQQLSFQLNDVAVQYAAGTSASIIFAQQSGQVVQALSLIAGEAKGVLGFLGSPWFMAFTTALVVLSPFVGKLLEGNDALGESIDKLRKDAAETDLNRRAKEAFTRTIEGQIDAQRRLNEEMERGLKSQGQTDRENLSTSQANVAGRSNDLARLKKQLSAAERAASAQDLLIRAAPSGVDPTLNIVQAQQAETKLRALRAEVTRLRTAVKEAEQGVRDARIVLSISEADAIGDPLKAIANRYQKLRDDAIAAARGNDRLTTSLKGTLAAINQRERAETEVERKRQSAASARPARDGDTATAAAIAKMLRSALPGVHVTATTNGKHVAGSYHYKGQAVDFVPKGGMNSMTKEDVRQLFTSRGIDVVELLGPGDKGHSNHFHVAWTKGKNELSEFSDAARRAKEAQRELDTALAGVLNTFDPAAAAAKKYREELAAIDDLVAKGKLTFAQGEQLKIQPLVNDSASRAREALDSVFADADDWFRQANDRSKDAQREIVDSWMSAADTFRYAASSLTDIMGVQLRGPAAMLLQPGGIEARATDTAKALTDSLIRSGIKINPESVNKLTADLGTVIGNASYGQIGGSVFASITGGKGSKTGSAVGGILGGEAGKAVGGVIAKEVGGALGKTLGSAAGPLGAIAGGVIGSVVGGLFKKAVKGSVSITGTDKGSTSYQGSGSYAAALNGNASSVQQGLLRIADQLGARLGAFDVAIGKRDDWYHVGGNSSVRVMDAHPTGLVYEGKDESEAIRAAILNALQDGAVKGITEASQRILKSGQDLDQALQKALMIEAVPKDLKAMLDPVGSAVDELNRKFQKTVDALKEGGASAEQMAQAERLYNLQLEQTKSSTSSASQALKDFLTSLKLGSSSPYSLRDQEATARAALNPYLDQIAAGKSVDQAKYQSAATAFLDIERQLYGSTQAYFDAMDAVQAATNKAISAIDNAEPITTAVESPFVKATAASAATTAANTHVSNELLSQLSEQMGSLQAAVEALAAIGYSTSGFIGSDRLFASAA